MTININIKNIKIEIEDVSIADNLTSNTEKEYEFNDEELTGEKDFDSLFMDSDELEDCEVNVDESGIYFTYPDVDCEDGFCQIKKD